MKFRHIILAAVFLLAAYIPATATSNIQTSIEQVESIPGPGDKEKKKKKGKDDDEDKNKMSRKKYKPAKHARTSAKNAKKALKMKETQVQNRAKVRNFFHRTFNTKFGKPVNFRKKRRRNRWKKGR